MRIKKDNSSNPYMVDEDVYKGVVSNIEKKKGNRGYFLAWDFKLKNARRDGKKVPKEEEVTVSGLTPVHLSDGSKLDKFLKACGVDTDDGEVADLDDALGEEVRVVIEHQKGKDNTVYSRVTKLLPIDSDDEDDEEEEKPKKKKKVKKSSTKGKGKKKEPKPEDEDDDEDDEEEEVEDEDEEEEEEKPKKKRGRPKGSKTKKATKTSKKTPKKKKKEEPEEDEEEDDEDLEDLFDFDDDDDDED